jgi:hypothetical protein
LAALAACTAGRRDWQERGPPAGVASGSPAPPGRRRDQARASDDDSSPSAVYPRLHVTLAPMDGGLDPTLAAILPLVGVLLGALLGGAANWLLKRRDERRESRSVARLIDDELRHCETLVSLNFRDPPLPSDWAPPREVWNAHRLLLARHLSDDDWDELLTTYQQVEMAGSLISLGVSGQEREKRVDWLIERITGARAICARHAGRASPREADFLDVLDSIRSDQDQ